ncbi:GTP cyclohydrolase I FolE [Candidatus Lucifugimonas marina]|uniref:GTP cyclohydrolase 1 n=1 Tax=Candidatus Lucifugimonas marina TaxID=3038979 RepID=A0AAJ6CV11_9CHLR|nr:GTP cyclohydrolase I FolE [SAR202 cluster bacterium JH702]MDG0870987.1 GTP cyclohydrolase I FolE [SAR202 cluster bacterium JH639]WFG35869.1 GTP cyclohydrolase I FolE [SAR202 cluster bacterium JH545]WFG39814.1 GTP cyclohydrolase I FolE [SAR202 cluster bacterium JH1073]
MLQSKTRVESIEHAITGVLEAVGEDASREGLVGTPNRVARMYGELLSGYNVDPTELLNGALFEVEHEQMVVVTNIEFQSLCEHHMLPFTGMANVAYIPDKQVVGLSKIPRIVDMYARRLQIQERMTKQIAETISTLVEPLGVGVTLTGSHMCSTIRGVRKQNSLMTTSCMTGSLKSNSLLRSEFLTQIQIDKQ